MLWKGEGSCIMFVDGLRLDQLEALGLVIDGSPASRDLVGNEAKRSYLTLSRLTNRNVLGRGTK